MVPAILFGAGFCLRIGYLELAAALAGAATLLLIDYARP
jgi:hypothetical protein